MGRPRKIQNDPKPLQQEQTDIKLVLYAVSLAGVIAQNRAISHEQAAKTAMEYADAAMKIWS